jgi:tol-pal system protein YbgF
MHRFHIPALLLLVLLAPQASYAAANKEHLQLMAEIRMLQEQQQQLQAMIGSLSDALKAVSSKLDDQNAAMRKAMADQTLAVNGLGDNVRVIREKLDDTNVRIATASQEIDALRQAIAAAQAAPAVGPGVAPTGTEPGAVTPPTGTQPATQPVNPVSPPGTMGQSPQRAYDTSFDDYSAGRYELAITGFQSYISQFPRSPNSPNAQFYIGQAYSAQSKWPEARDAFQKVISDYPQSAVVPDAYYKLGQTYERLNQVDLAKKAYDTAISQFANSSAGLLAKQALDRLNRK